MKKLRVLQVGMVYKLGGGIQTFIMNYYKNIDRDKIQFDFINIYGDKFYYKDEIESLGGKIYNLPNYYKHPFKFIKEMKNIINNNNYEIVHCNMNSAVMLHPLIAAKISKAKVVISHAHNSSSDKGVIKKILHNINRHLIPLFANYYFSCSNVAGAWFYSKKILKSNKYFIIKNAINCDKFNNIEFDKKIYKKELGIDNYKEIILNVGRFARQKNHKFLIEIFKKYHLKHKDSVLLLVGDGELFDEIKTSSKDTDSIKFLGRREDVNKIMSISDIFVMPSLYEGLPLVGVEAQYCGLPCIFSNTISKEIAISKKLKFLSLNDSTNIWVEEIEKLIGKKNSILDDSYNIKLEAIRLVKLYDAFLNKEGDVK